MNYIFDSTDRLNQQDQQTQNLRESFEALIFIISSVLVDSTITKQVHNPVEYKAVKNIIKKI